MYASAYVLVTTAIDRYIAICHPMRSHTWTSTTAHYMVLYAWVVALIFAIPQLIIFDFILLPEPSTEYDCWVNFEPVGKLISIILGNEKVGLRGLNHEANLQKKLS